MVSISQQCENMPNERNKLPEVTKNKIWNKSFWAALVITILAALGWGLIQLSSLSLGASVLTSTAFITTLIVVLLVAVGIDHISNGGKKYYFGQNIVAAVVVALFLPVILGFMGINSLGGGLSINLIGIFISVAILMGLTLEVMKRYLHK